MKVSKVSFFFFILTYNYLLLRALVFPYLYNECGVNGYIYIGIILLIILLFFLVLPRKFISIDLLEKYRNSKIKYLVNIILLLRIGFGAYYGATTISYLFFKDTSPWILVIGLCLLIIILSSLKPSDVIQITTLFGIVILIIYLAYMLSFVSPDFSAIYLLYDFKMKPFVFLFSMLLIGDNYLILFCNKDEFEFSKKTFLIAISITFLFFCFEYMSLSLTFGDFYFKNMNYIGFIPLGIKSVSRYFGNFEYVYILLITASSVFKFSYFFSIVKYSFDFKNKLKISDNFIYLPIIVLICLAAIIINKINQDIFVNTITILVGLCFFTIIYGIKILFFNLKE